VNPTLNFFEKRFTIFTLIVLTGIINCTSYYNGSREGSTEAYFYSPLDRLVTLFTYAIYAFTFFFIIARFKKVIRPALRDPFLWALVGLCLTSFIWSDFPEVSRKYGLLTLYSTLFGLYMASRYSLKEQLNIIVWAMGISTIFSFLYSLALPGAAKETGMHAGAWRGPLIHKNTFARFAAFLAIPPLLVGLDKGKNRSIIWIIFAISALLVQMSTSKTALLIFLILVMMLPLYSALRWSDNILIPIAITVLLIGGSISIWLVGNWEPFLFSIGRDPTLSGRTDIWTAMLDKAWERPWLGYGFQTFWVDGGGGEYVWRAIRYKVGHAHNGFLNIIADLGFLGLFFFLASIAFTYYRAIIYLRSGKSSAELWPIMYVTFFFMYNHSESTIIEANNIFWVLYVSVSLSLRRVPLPKREKFAPPSAKQILSESN
jgi:O-antigen ligase